MKDYYYQLFLSAWKTFVGHADAQFPLQSTPVEHHGSCMLRSMSNAI